MKSTFTRMAAIALTMGLGLAASAANATGVKTMSGWDGSAATGYSANFGNNGVGAIFNDTYTFSLPGDASGNGGANVISLGGNGVIFTAFTLYETSAGLLGSGGTGGTTSSLSFSHGAVPGAYTLNVNGHKTDSDLAGSYAGNVVVSPVPEPKTYAMMLLGLGLMGFSARRRLNNL
jgi:hypothetical protein